MIIDEIKLILDSLQGIPEMGLWVLGGLLGYKLVTYLASAGAVMYALKLISYTVLRLQENKATKATLVRFGDVLMADAHTEVEDLLRSLRKPQLRYVHKSDVEELTRVWNTYLDVKKDKA